jgi:hypothetical protein
MRPLTKKSCLIFLKTKEKVTHQQKEQFPKSKQRLNSLLLIKNLKKKKFQLLLKLRELKNSNKKLANFSQVKTAKRNDFIAIFNLKFNFLYL